MPNKRTLEKRLRLMKAVADAAIEWNGAINDFTGAHESVLGKAVIDLEKHQNRYGPLKFTAELVPDPEEDKKEEARAKFIAEALMLCQEVLGVPIDSSSLFRTDKGTGDGSE